MLERVLVLRREFEPRPELKIYFDTIASASKFLVRFLVGTIAQILLSILILKHGLYTVAQVLNSFAL